jgi:UDP-N-acetylglucosamine transferase subunit ALG13
MIFCTVGTTEFDPLVQAMDALAPGLDEPVIFQIGQGIYEPAHGEWFRFRSSIEDLVAEASLVVAHGGFGTTIEVLQSGAPLVSVPNPDRYDQHQEAILRRFEADGYLVACYDLAGLENAIARARTEPSKPYPRPQTTLHLEIKAFLANRRG